MKKNFHIIVISFVISIVIWGSISLSGLYYVDTTLPLKLTDFPEGFSIGSKIPDEVIVRVKGRGWSLLNFLLSDDIALKASLRSDSGKINLNLLANLTDNYWVSTDLQVINVIPSIISVAVDRGVEKIVPVVPDFQLDFKTGYGIASPIKIVPDSVKLYGSNNLLKTINAIKTELKNFSQIDAALEFECQLEKIKNVRASSSKIEVAIDVQKIVDREFTEIIVQPENVPADRNVVFLPSTINVTLRGGIEIVGALTVDSLISKIEYQEILDDTLGSVAPKIFLPQNVELIKIKPERIRYIIKKF